MSYCFIDQCIWSLHFFFKKILLTCGPTPWYRQLTTLSSRLISSFWLKSSSCLAAWSANIVIIAGIELCGGQGGNIQQGWSQVKWTFGITNANSWPSPPPPSTQDHPESRIWPDLPTHQCLLKDLILNNNGIGGWRDKGNMISELISQYVRETRATHWARDHMSHYSLNETTC